VVVSAAHFKDVTNGYEKRTDGLWVHTGKFIVKGGPVDLPAGSIDTAELAPGAAQALIGSYKANPGWNTSVVGSWVETPFVVNAACSGARVRIEGQMAAHNSVKGGGYYGGGGVKGVATMGCAYWNAPEAGYTVNSYVIDYYTPTAGMNRFALFVQNVTAGTVTFNAAVNAMLFITEQRA